MVCLRFVSRRTFPPSVLYVATSNRQAAATQKTPATTTTATHETCGLALEQEELQFVTKTNAATATTEIALTKFIICRDSDNFALYQLMTLSANVGQDRI